MNIEKKKRISVADFGGKAILAAAAEVSRLVLGIVGGIASGTAESETVTGDIVIGLRGAFRFEPVTGAALGAPVLWLPGDADEAIKAALGAKDGPPELEFVFEVAAVRVGEAGFAYELTPVLPLAPAAQADPVTALFDEAKAKAAEPEVVEDKGGKAK